MTSTIYKEIELSKYNKLTIIIEETFMDNYSIVLFDDYAGEEGGIWGELFADTYDKAVQIAESQIKRIVKGY